MYQNLIYNLEMELYGYFCSNFYRDFTYYKMNNLDNRISNPDQLLTTDVERFCSSITDLYSNISKPLLDIIIYVQKLSATIGGQVTSFYADWIFYIFYSQRHIYPNVALTFRHLT